MKSLFLRKFHAAVMVGMIFCGVTVAESSNSISGPDPREIPLPPIKTTLESLPGMDALPVRTSLPDALTMNTGVKITTIQQWNERRGEIKRILEYYAIGRMPPPPGNVKGREIKSQLVLEGKVRYRLVHLTFGPQEKLGLDVGIFTPTDTPGLFPAVIMPGGTPPGAKSLTALAHPPGQGKGVDALLPVVPSTNQVTAARSPRSDNSDPEKIADRNRELFRRGYAYVTFNNNDCAEDTTLRNDDGSWAFRSTRFYPAYPGYDWGVLAGWAWGVSRIVDYLETDPSIDKTRLDCLGGIAHRQVGDDRGGV